jgi:hypothetical protein
VTQRRDILRRACKRIAVTALFLLCAAWQDALAVDVSTSHPVYTFLKRAEALGLLRQTLSQAEPYSREDVRDLLESLDARRGELSAVDIRLLDEYQSQFADSDDAAARDERDFTFGIYENGHDLAQMRGQNWAIYGEPVVEARQEYHRFPMDSTGHMTVWASGFEIRGDVRRFGFLLRTTDSHVRGDARLADYATFPYRYDVHPSGFDYDEADAEITYRAPHVDLLFGKTRNRWGGGWFDALSLSDQPTSYTQFRARFRLGPAELTAVQAKLQQTPPVIMSVDTTDEGIAQNQYAEKFLAAHRLQFDIGERWQIGLYESVVYGKRGFDLDYLNPVMFLRSAEHYADDRDNAMVGADFRWRPVNGVIAQGELLIDDVSTTKLGQGWYGNKLGYQGGFECFDPIGLGNTRLVCEYTRIEPYVYSHKFAINNFQQYGVILGAETGPNSDVATVSLGWTVAPPLEVEVWSQLRRHGANPASGRNVGGDFLRPWGPGDSKSVHFLDGDLETTKTIGLKCRVEVIRGVYLSGTAVYAGTDYRLETGHRDSDYHSVGALELRWNPW